MSEGFEVVDLGTLLEEKSQLERVLAAQAEQIAELMKTVQTLLVENAQLKTRVGELEMQLAQSWADRHRHPRRRPSLLMRVGAAELPRVRLRSCDPAGAAYCL